MRSTELKTFVIGLLTEALATPDIISAWVPSSDNILWFGKCKVVTKMIAVKISVPVGYVAQLCHKQHYCLHFTGEEMEAHRGRVADPESGLGSG